MRRTEALRKTQLEPSDPCSLLNRIGQTFNVHRESSMIQAWRGLQKDIMDHLGDLCVMSRADVVPPFTAQQAIATVRDAEEFIRGSAQKAGQSPEEALQAWLNREEPGAAKETKQ
jgi:hypothetical protein